MDKKGEPNPSKCCAMVKPIYGTTPQCHFVLSFIRILASLPLALHL